jgi:putative Mn2+ efflux pump MntP
MLEVILLSIALSMDVFAVSIGIGVNQSGKSQPELKGDSPFLSALIIAIYSRVVWRHYTNCHRIQNFIVLIF